MTTSVDAHAAAKAISRYRRWHRLSAVRVHPQLMTVARNKAEHMARGGRVGHATAEFERRMIASGFNPHGARENIAAGHQTFDAVFADWKTSVGHNAAMLMPDSTHIGIAAAEAPRTDYKVFWALVIGTEIDRRQQLAEVRRGPLQLPVWPPPAKQRVWMWVSRLWS